MDKNKNKIATGGGIAGVVIFVVLNFATKGVIPGGAVGGVIGFLLGYGIAWLVLMFLPKKTSNQEKQDKE